MIRYVANKISDQLGRSNFVDGRGLCIGFKEYPDGTPMRWRCDTYDHCVNAELALDANGYLSRVFAADDFVRSGGIREFLDKSRYNIGFRAVVQQRTEDHLVYAVVHLVPDMGYESKNDIVVLYVLLCGPGDIYFADFSMSDGDREKLFGGIDPESMRFRLARMRGDVNRLLKDISEMEKMFDSEERRLTAGAGCDTIEDNKGKEENQ